MGVHPGISKTIKVIAAGVTGPFKGLPGVWQVYAVERV
jgi:hypothetical protein